MRFLPTWDSEVKGDFRARMCAFATSRTSMVWGGTSNCRGGSFLLERTSCNKIPLDANPWKSPGAISVPGANGPSTRHGLTVHETDN